MWQTKAINNDLSGSICQIGFGVILPLLMKLLIEMIIIPELTLVAHSVVLLELSMLTNYIKALSTAETTYTQNWDGTAITGSKAITLANSLYFYVLPNDQTKAAREQEDPEEEGQAFVLDKTTLASELVISGEVYIKAIMNDNTSWTFGEESTPVLRYWPIKIGIDGLDSEDTYYGQVHRNVVYNISATIAGNGYADPTLPKGDPTADLFVKTMVMNWGTATQAPVIE